MKTILPALFLLIALCASSAQARIQATPPAARIQAAMQKVFAGQVDEGISDLETIAADHPEVLQVWTALGSARRTAGKYAESADAYLKALELQPETGGIELQAGISYGMMGDMDRAFDLLKKAADSGNVNMAQLEGSPARDNLMADPRYAALFPTEEEFNDPFVEDTRILQEWRGENRGDQFGWIARNIGDVDGDGIDDSATSAPSYGDAGSSIGKIYVYSSRSGNLLWSAQGPVAGGQLGHQIDAGGDINGDGIPDVVASAPFANLVLAYSGDDGHELFRITGDDPAGAFGTGLKGIGDADGDGFGDILIGEPYQIWGGPINGGDGSQPGTVYLYSGKDRSILLTLEGKSPGDGFGRAVAGRTIDGRTTFIVGAPGAGDAHRGEAAIYQDLSGKPSFEVAADSGGIQFGQMFMSVVGDIDADGIQDVYISDWQDATERPGSGRIYVYSGRDGSRITATSGTTPGEGFGIGIGDAGDVDGDGHDDLVVGSWQYAAAAVSGGRISVISGGDGRMLQTVTGKVPSETLGFDATGIGDVDGDGTPDMLVTSAYSLIKGFHTGRVFILAGAPVSGR